MSAELFYQKLAQQCIAAPPIDNGGEFLESAVIVPLLEENGRLSVLFEVRAQTLNRQPGEICFPGGRIEAGETPLAAAVRETAEELSIARDCIRVLGPLPVVASPIGVMLFPYAGVLSGGCRIRPSKAEVEECFTVPLDWLLRAKPFVGKMETATRPVSGIPANLLPEDYSPGWKRRHSYPVWFYRYRERVIWGLTGRVLAAFLAICKQG
ncbi:MAG: CoA pyrophosphatase [Sporomusaceae bacterium]|nr:CoA pyrophosphatase [Sporomusaceae bacterium]